MYPDSFGGIYINCYGELVVLVVEGLRESAIQGFADNLVEDGVLVRNVEFAYNVLRDTFDMLGVIVPNSPNNIAASNVDGISLDVINNQLLISLAVYTEEKIMLFREMVHDAPYLAFHLSPGIASYSYNQHLYNSAYETYADWYVLDEGVVELDNVRSISPVRPGNTLFVRGNTGLREAGSVGYRATAVINGREQVGFVTAAHLGLDPNLFGRILRVGDRFYNSAGQHIGTVQLTQRHALDLAFFTLAPGITSNTATHMGNVLPRTIPPTTGSIVFLDGLHGRGRDGTIRTSWQGNTGSGWTFGFRTTYFSDHGDSGGIVYSWTNVSNNGVAGIHAAGWGYGHWADRGNALFTTVGDHIHDLWFFQHNLRLH